MGVSPGSALESLGQSLGLQHPQLSDEHVNIHLRAAVMVRRGKMCEALSTMSGT